MVRSWPLNKAIIFSVVSGTIVVSELVAYRRVYVVRHRGGATEIGEQWFRRRG